MSKMVSILVACARRKGEHTEFLAKVEGEKLIIGAKRKYTNNQVSSSNAGQLGSELKKSHKDLKHERTNGVEYGCLHCDSNTFFICHCGVHTCKYRREDVTCSGCGKFFREEELLTAESLKIEQSVKKPVSAKPSYSYLDKIGVIPNIKKLPK